MRIQGKQLLAQHNIIYDVIYRTYVINHISYNIHSRIILPLAVSIRDHTIRRRRKTSLNTYTLAYYHNILYTYYTHIIYEYTLNKEI